MDDVLKKNHRGHGKLKSETSFRASSKTAQLSSPCPRGGLGMQTPSLGSPGQRIRGVPRGGQGGQLPALPSPAGCPAHRGPAPWLRTQPVSTPLMSEGPWHVTAHTGCFSWLCGQRGPWDPFPRFFSHKAQLSLLPALGSFPSTSSPWRRKPEGAPTRSCRRTPCPGPDANTEGRRGGVSRAPAPGSAAVAASTRPGHR